MLARPALDWPDSHLRATDHEEVAASLLTKLVAGEYTGTKPGKNTWGEMHPPMRDGYVLAQFILQLAQTVEHLSSANPQSLDG